MYKGLVELPEQFRATPLENSGTSMHYTAMALIAEIGYERYDESDLPSQAVDHTIYQIIKDRMLRMAPDIHDAVMPTAIASVSPYVSTPGAAILWAWSLIYLARMQGPMGLPERITAQTVVQHWKSPVIHPATYEWAWTQQKHEGVNALDIPAFWKPDNPAYGDPKAAAQILVKGK